MAVSSFSSSASATIELNSLSPRVFVNFRGAELRYSFISHLEKALRDGGIHYFIDEQLDPGEDIERLLQHIELSKIALAIFSKRYSESKWCLKELVKIMENVEENKLVVIPIFFNVKVEDVKNQRGEFGLNLYGDSHPDRSDMPKWEKALKSAPGKKGLTRADSTSESEFVNQIVVAVKNAVDRILAVSQEGERSSMSSINTSSVSSSVNIISRNIQQPAGTLYGIDQRLKQLEEKLLDFKCLELRIIGIIGMPGIGKTTLAKMYYERWDHMYTINEYISGVREESTRGSDWLERKLLKGQDLNDDEAEICKTKMFIVLDDVSHKDQVDFLLKNRGRIKGGSKIVIIAHHKSPIQELVDDIYVVSGLKDKEALQLFNDYAFYDQACCNTGNFPKLAQRFVEYADGNSRALKELGNEICGKDEAYWKKRLKKLPRCCIPKIRTNLRISYDELTDQQKDAFLDIACFFKSEDEDYVKCLLNQCGSESGDVVQDLTEKLLICVSAGRIEMHNLLCTFGKEIGLSDENKSGERMWCSQKTIDTLYSHVREGKKKVRGIILDVSNIDDGIPLGENIFIKLFDQLHLRYIKVFDSLCPQQCNRDCKANLPDGLSFPFQEIRYFHWLKFPLSELPLDFKPENLIDLRLPYSEIQYVWKTAKEAPRLKWVDLSYSTKLIKLSALSKAIDLRRLNLEGCTNLIELPKEMNNMKSLVFINLRGCITLSSLPAKLNLNSLKTLILSGCSNFGKFELNSENLEYLHLDGTAIKTLPTSIKKFEKLVILNLKECKMLVSLPHCLHKLKALEELMLSGCSELRSFPEIKETMENLQILLLDGTSIEEVPHILSRCGKFQDPVACQQPLRVNGVPLLRRLCLSGNDAIRSLGPSISQLYHLKWIDLKNCQHLESISTLPPNLQCLDAHNCTSLKTVASPLAPLMSTTQQVPSSFIFTNCEKLKEDTKNDILCYAYNKSRLLSEALNRHNKGLFFEALVATSFPGSEVPAWFSHIASGAQIKPELPRHWSENGFVGIALCAIVSFENNKIRNNQLQVKCKCEFSNNETSYSNFNCHIGGLSETGDEERTINSPHVFIGYTNWLNINKCQLEDGVTGCVPTEASIDFEVSVGTSKLMNCEVLKCGFSLVYESGSWDASSRTEKTKQGESILLGLLSGVKWFFKYGANRNNR